MRIFLLVQIVLILIFWLYEYFVYINNCCSLPLRLRFVGGSDFIGKYNFLLLMQPFRSLFGPICFIIKLHSIIALFQISIQYKFRIYKWYFIFHLIWILYHTRWVLSDLTHSDRVVVEFTSIESAHFLDNHLSVINIV